MNDSTPSRTHSDPREEIAHRANEIQIKLLDWIEREIGAGKIPSTYLEAYETLCRAERTRRGV